MGVRVSTAGRRRRQGLLPCERGQRSRRRGCWLRLRRRRTSSTYTLADNVEQLNLAADAGDISGTGNALDNAIHGNLGNNTLHGQGGNDEILAGDGNDTEGGDGETFSTAAQGTMCSRAAATTCWPA